MQKLVEVRKRVAAVHSIRSVASTLATVASAKLSRTRERASGMRGYAERMREVVRRQQAAAATSGVSLTAMSPFLATRPDVRRILLVHLSADRGMCGAYNSAIDREAVDFIRARTDEGIEVQVFAKGRKGERYLRRRAGADVVGAEGWLRAGVTDAEVDSLAEIVSSAFLSGDADEVWCAYTRFYSPMRRYPSIVRLLPLAFESGARRSDETAVPSRWFYEPSREATVAELLSVFLRLQVNDALLESYAAEQGARMITMEEATERADRALQELTVASNRLRRETITSDLLGILFASALRAEESPDARLGAGEEGAT